MVQPDYAVFGEKDFQQLLVVKQMVRDLNLPIKIIAGGIKREADGLAMSSRNNYLDLSDREKSCYLSRALKLCCEQVQEGKDIRDAESNALQLVENEGFIVDYLTLRKARDLSNVSREDIVANDELVVLAAATIAGTRLIDNIRFMPSERL
jgi:pantoate--beta-alanine ligase